MDLSNVKSLLRAVVQSSKEGVPLSRLSGEYRVITGDHVPFKKLGYPTLEEFLRTIPDVANVRRNRDGDLTVYAVADESTAHLEQLIAKQKTAKKRSRGGRRSTPRITRSFAGHRPRGGRGGWRGGPSNLPSRFTPTPTKFSTSAPPIHYSFSRRVFHSHGDDSELSVTVPNTVQQKPPLMSTPVREIPPRFQKLLTPSQTKPAAGQKPTASKPEIHVPVSKPDASPSSKTIKDYKSGLFKYFAKNKLGTPTFSTHQTQTGGYISCVRVKGLNFGSEQIVLSKKMAEQLAAQNACKYLEIDDATIESFPKKTPKKPSPDNKVKGPDLQAMVLGGATDRSEAEVGDITNIEEIKNRVRDLIATKPSGMWNTRFPIEYKAKYDEDLPQNYGTLLESWTDVITIEQSAAGNDMKIYYPVNQSTTKMAETAASAAARSRIEKVDIPPGKTYKAGDKLKVYILHTLHCNEFYVQEQTSCINEIMKDIRDIYETRGCPKEISKAEIGSYCVAQFTEDMNWYRAQIISTRVSGKFEKEVEVLYVDFGNTEFLPKSRTKRMLSSVAEQPIQAIKCSLHGISPTESSWRADCINEFCKLTAEQLLTVEVIDVNDDTCDVILGNDIICINDILVEKGYAKHRMIEPDDLVIPTETNLDIFISFIHKTTDLMVRLVGPGYSEKLEDLESQMEAFYATKSNPPSFVRAGSLYAVLVDNEDGVVINRVRAIHVDGDEVNVSYMDHGGSEKVKVSQLRNLDKQFRKLPYQAVTVSLSGLEEFDTNEAILEKLFDEVLGKTCVAEVVDRSDRLSVVLYDTSTTEDVNINEMLTEMLGDQDLSPQLPNDCSLKEVYIIHIDPNGVFHVQVPGPGLKRLEVMMAEITAHFSKKVGADEFIAAPQPGQIVCARYQADKRWYRAEVLQVLPDRMVEVYYVDYGNSEVTEISQLRSAKKASPHSLELPHQAIKCTLYGLPPPGKMWTADTVTTLEASMDFDAFVPIKVVTPATDDTPAEVVMFLFNESDKEFMPMNEDMLEFAEDLETEINSLIDDLDDVALDETAEAIFAKEIANGDNNDVSNMAETTVDGANIGIHNWLVLDETNMDKSLRSEENNNETAGATNGSGSVHSNSNSDSLDSVPLAGTRSKSVDSGASFDCLTEPLSSRRLKYYRKIPIPSRADVPDVGKFFDVHVTYAANPSNFSVAPYESQSDLEALMSEMYNAYTYKWQSTNLMDFHRGQLYAAFYDKLWYRVQVQEVLTDQKMVSARFVDYGDFDILPMDTLQPLPGDYRELPLQAIKAELSGIGPVDGKSWSTDCEKRFSELISDQDLVALIKENDTSGDKPLKLQLVDTSDEENDVCIADILVSEGFATVV